MNKAQQLIEAIASNMSEVNKLLDDILTVLEDGEALLFLGATDEDQEAVDEARDMIREMIDNGRQYLAE